MLLSGSETNISAKATDHAQAIGQMGDGNIVTNINLEIRVCNPETSNLQTSLSSSELKINDAINQQIDETKELLSKGKPDKCIERANRIEQTFSGLLNNQHKFRLLTNKGNAFALLRQYADAYSSFLEAFDIDDSNEVAHANRIKAYSLMQDKNNLKKAINEAQTKFKTSRKVASTILEIIQNDLNYKDLSEFVGEYCFDDASCCLMASQFYYNRGNADKAIQLAEKANQIKPNDWQILGILGTDILYNLLKEIDIRFLSLMSKSQVESLYKAKDFLEKSWVNAKETELPFTHIAFIPINLSSIYKLLKEEDKEREIVDTLIQHMPDNPDIVIKKILLSHNAKDCQPFLSKLDPSSRNEYALVMAMVYMQQDEYEKALECLNKAPNKDDYQIILMKVHCFKELGNLETIEKLKKSRLPRALKSVFDYIVSNDIKELIKAKSSLLKSDNRYIKLEIAQALYHRGQYREASEIYKGLILNISPKDLVFRHYLNCLLLSNQLNELKNNIDMISENELDEALLEILAFFYAKSSNFTKASEIYENLYLLHPNNAEYICNLLYIYRLQRQEQKIKDILNKLPSDLNGMNGNIKCKYAIILHIEENFGFNSAIPKAYELTAQNMEDANAWNSYFSFCITKPLISNNNTAFILSDDITKNTKIYFIEDNKNIKSTNFFHILSSNDMLTKELLQHKQGDIFKLGYTDLKISEITNKYIALFKIIQSNIFIEFPKNSQIQRVDGNVDAFIQYSLDNFKRQDGLWHDMEEAYNTGFPISTVAGMLKRDVFTIVNTFEQKCMKVSLGNWDEKNHAHDIVLQRPSYIIDTITLYHIFEFGVQDIIASILRGKIYASPSIKDHIQQKIDSINTLIQDKAGHMMFDKKSEKIVLYNYEDLQDFYQQELNLYENISDWIDKNITLITPSFSVNLEENEKKLLSVIGEVDQETQQLIDIAIENNLVLLSNDLKLRLFANKFNVQGIWLQALLMNYKISHDRYVQFLQNSILKNHTFITFNSNDLFSVLLTDKTEDLSEFKLFANRLEISSADTAAKVIYDFTIFHLKNNKDAQNVFNIIIDAYLKGGCHKEFALRWSILMHLAQQNKTFSDYLHPWQIGHFIN